MKVFEKDCLKVEIYESRKEMGVAASRDTAKCIKDLLEKKQNIRMIFAAAPSQNEFLEALISDKDIDWTRIDAFHMDEYVGLAADAPQGFGNFLDRAIFSRVPFKSVSYINGQQDPETTCKEYAEKLTSAPIDIVCMGVGENGHIAFNDPLLPISMISKLSKRLSLMKFAAINRLTMVALQSSAMFRSMR